ncbi:hypothetical protein JHK85_010002 [Glycine max]|nr:hypothetical protein JHK85_010002 [Glycine max]
MDRIEKHIRTIKECVTSNHPLRIYLNFSFKRGVPVFWEPWIILSVTTERDSKRVREEWPQGPGGEVVGPTSGGAESRLGRRVRESLQVELGVGRGGCRGANGCVATVHGAAREQARDGVEMKVAVAVEQREEDEFVSEEEVEKRLREVIV